MLFESTPTDPWASVLVIKVPKQYNLWNMGNRITVLIPYSRHFYFIFEISFPWPLSKLVQTFFVEVNRVAVIRPDHL
jgi:hypothetical protein